MKFLSVRLVLVCILLFAALTVSVSAKPPTLAPITDRPLPTEAKINQPQELALTYQGDTPTKLSLIVLTPLGEIVTVPGKASPADTTGDVSVVWPYTPGESGEYRYHFEAQAGDIGGVRYPSSPADDFQFVVANPLIRYAISGAGLLTCLLLLPFVSYVATRSLNQRGDAATAARISLLIGTVAFVGLLVFVWTQSSTEYHWLGLALGGVLLLAVLVGLFTRRRAI